MCNFNGNILLTLNFMYELVNVKNVAKSFMGFVYRKLLKAVLLTQCIFQKFLFKNRFILKPLTSDFCLSHFWIRYFFNLY